MDEPESRFLKELMTGPRLLSLAVLVDGAPLVGLLPFAMKPDLSAAIVHASQLARHSRGLARGAAFGALIHAADSPDADARQVPRVSLEGVVEPLEPGTPAWGEAQALYLARFPDSESIFQLPDFRLYELRFEQGRLVGGFGFARNLSPDTLRKAATA